MRILILGSDNFCGPLKSMGHQALYAGRPPEADIALPGLDPDWRQVNAALGKAGFKPDAILVTDDVGRRTLPTGLWAAEAVTVFYGIDAPLNRFWQTPYSRLFDLAFLDQRGPAHDLAAEHPGAHWLPVGIDPKHYQAAGAEPQDGVCFVGVVDRAVRPKRSAVLDRVAKSARLVIKGGRGQGWFPTAKAAGLYAGFSLVLNENLFPGVTTRPLEVMASGGALLSEAAPGQMDRFFGDLCHLAFFSPADLDEKLKLLMADKDLRGRLAGQGREAVLAEHTLAKRAAEILRRIEKFRAAPGPNRAQGASAMGYEGQALCMAGLRWPKDDGRGRLARGLGRLGAVCQNGSSTPLWLVAHGLAALALGDGPTALKSLARGAQAGGAGSTLAWLMALQHLQGPQKLRGVLAGLNGPWRDLASAPHPAEFHLRAARVLAGEGLDLEPGFDLRLAGPPAWRAMEHLLEAVRLEPGLVPAWEELGDLLARNQSPNQAWQCYQRAAHKNPGPALAKKINTAAFEGYLS